MTICIQNGTLVSGAGTRPGDLLIEDGIIQSVGVGLSGDQNIDAAGCLVFPGFIDGHTHLDMPVSGTVTADDFRTGSEAALVGGTTMLIDFADLLQTDVYGCRTPFYPSSWSLGSVYMKMNNILG